MVPIHSSISTFKTQGAPSEVQSALSALEKNLFVRAKDLLDQVAITTKDTKGTVNWIMLNSKYHSVLVRTAIATAKANGSKHSIASIKEALFAFLLNILNGKTQQNFFPQAGQDKCYDTNRFLTFLVM
ncbi:hypothetical protein EI94DRAFT_1701075 [Lactarius quietus]|nr:hypothetical protein EI94DRAFT_1701075 [Lactarius quietus]